MNEHDCPTGACHYDSPMGIPPGQGFPRIIGFTGRIGTGKTTSARIMAEKMAEFKDVVGLSFAFKLKAIARGMGWAGEKDGPGRRLLQLLGTEVGRECLGEDYWVRHWKNEVLDVKSRFLHHNHLLILVDDVRFPNEAEAIREQSGIIIRISRANRPRNGKVDEHASEKEVDSITPNFVICNDGSMEDLKDCINEVLTLIIRERGL